MPLDVGLNTADDAMGAAMQAVGADLVGRKIRASIDPSEPLLIGSFDLAHTVRILANLLENAIKYGPPSAPVDFAVRRDGSELVFTVADRGPGIASGDGERIYQPFHRGAHVGSETRGTGLGLAIARRLAEAQRGTLSHHTREGGGTVFLLRLPAADLSDADALASL
jgi:two-component system, OmpR family, sensor histidine kinase KdpD